VVAQDATDTNLEKTMKLKSLTFAGLAVVASLGSAMIATPAFASPNPALTSISVSPSTYRSGDLLTVTANGSTTGTYGFYGCEFTTFNGAPISTIGINDNDYVDGGTGVSYAPNYFAEPVQYRVYGYAGNNCTDPVSGSPTWDTSVFTVTPQLVVDDISLTVGVAPSASNAYTDASPTGVSPFNWTLGGSFTALPDNYCGITFSSVTDATLPAGITVDDTYSANGEEPQLTLLGSPAAGSEGTYKTCVSLTDGYVGSYAWVNITVTAATLPATGIDASALGLIVLGALVAMGIGAGFVVRRRAA
jgi:LPXTG-motif cell wall-anchored protein